MKLHFQLVILLLALLWSSQPALAQCTVNAAFTASADTVCAGSSVTFTSTSTGDTALSWLVNGAVLSTSTPFNYTPAAGGLYTVELVAANGTCSDTAAQTLWANALPSVFFPTPSPECDNVDPIVLPTAFPAGGTYAGISVTGNNFAPVVAGAGNHTLTYTYTDSNSCTGVDSVTMVVHPSPVVTFSGLTGLCEDAASFVLTTGSPLGGVYSGSGVSGISFFPSAAGVGSHILSYSYTDINGCSNGDTTIQDVFGLPGVSTGTLAPVCENGGLVTLSGGTPAGGTWSGAGVSANQFDPTVTGAGSTTLTYTYSNANNCSNQASGTITVNDPPAVVLTNSNDACDDDPIFSLTGGFPAGGTYSGLGVSNGQFDPVLAPPSIYPYTYEYTDNNGCTGTATDTITVHALPVVNFPDPTPVCGTGMVVTLDGGTPMGGTYASPFALGDQFFTTLSGAGTHNVEYTYTDAEGCSATDVAQVVVNPVPNVTQVALPGLCVNDNVTTLFGGSPSGGTYSGIGVVGGQFDPAAAGVGNYTITYTFTDNNGCTESASTPLVVNGLPSPQLGNDTQICSEPPFTLFPGAGFLGYNWGDGSTDPLFDVMVDGNYSVTVTDQNLCREADTIQVAFLTPAEVDLGPEEVFLEDFQELLLDGGGSRLAYLWSDNSTDRTITVNNTGQYWVVVTDSNGCTASDSINVTFWVTGLGEPAAPLEALVFPNPASNELTIQFNQQLSGVLGLRVMDLSGKVMLAETNVAGQPQVHFSVGDWPAGLYIIELSQGSTVERKKFTVFH